MNKSSSRSHAIVPQIHLDYSVITDDTVFNLGAFDPVRIPTEELEHAIWHKHPFYEFFYIYSGTLTLISDSETPELTLHEGDFCMIPVELYHRVYSHRVERACIAFSINQNKQSSKTYEYFTRLLKTIRVPIARSSAYIDIQMKQYRSCTINSTYFSKSQNMAIIMSTIFYMLSTLESFISDTSTKRSLPLHTDNRRSLIENYISGSFVNGSLTDLAEKLFISERRAGEVVRELTGKSFKELIISERMVVAGMLMKSGKYTLEEIAETVGYSSYSGFYTAYKKYFGHAPRRGERTD